MAENTQTFILVGEFKDNISPKLTKLNREIEALQKNFGKLSSKLRPISKEFGNMAGAAERMSDALKSQRGHIDNSVRALKEYRKEAGKVRAANDQMARSARRIPTATPGSPRGGGGRGGGGNLPLAAAGGGFVAGQGLANMITGAVVLGFQKGTQIMMLPFRYGANAIGERIKDEMSDIKSAGGMFAIDRRENLGIFKQLSDARQFQEELNARLAKSAASLPGETAEYVQQAKQLTDTVMLSLSKNKDEFIKFAQELDANAKTPTEAMGVVLQKFTEKAVLLGQGESGGAYGVPQILEMLVSQEQVNVKAFKKFASYNRNPLLKNALENAEGELRKTGANTAARFRVIQKVLDQAVPNEVVMDMQNSADGIIQAVKSAFLDPESGLLGLGRKLNVAMPRVDSLGRYVDRFGNVVGSAEEAFKDNASFFEVLKQTVGGFVLPLTGIMEILPQIYEPLSGLVTGFMDLRNVSQEFYAAFNRYTKYYEKQAESLGVQAQKLLDAGDKAGYERLAKKSQAIAQKAKLGGTLNALNDLLKAFSAIDEKEYQANAKSLMDIEKVNPAEMLKRMFSQLFSSDFMEELGSAIGSLVGGVLKAVGDLMAGVNDIAEAGPFAKGLKKGFEKAKGGEGISLIFKNLFSLIGKTLMTLFKSAPLQMSILTALTVGMPLLQGAITQGLIKMFTMAAAGMGAAGGAAGIGATISGWLGIVGPALSVVARLLPQVAATMAIIVGLGGGVENTKRQLSEFGLETLSSVKGGLQSFGDLMNQLVQFTADLIGGVVELTSAIFGLAGGVKFTAESFDLLKFLLVPITATFQLIEMGLRGLVEGLSNVRLWLLQLTNWGGRNNEKIKQAQEDLKTNTEKQNEAKRRIDVYNTAMRYGGAGNYAKVLEKDVAAKQREMDKAGLLKGEREKLNNELVALNKTLAEARRQAGNPLPGAKTTTQAAPSKPIGGVTPSGATTPAQTAAPTIKAIEDSKTATTAVKNAVDSASKLASTKANVQQKKTDTLIVGINAVKSALMAISSKISTESSLKLIAANTAKTNTLLESGKLKVSFSIGGVGGKGGPGMVDAFNPIASSFGLQVTSGFRPGDPGYHGSNRARDYSNGTGPTPQMLAFAKYMASSFGSDLAELIYTPLGFSIKNGQIVPPYAQAGHYNHVHVAFGQGLGNPTLFSNANAAMAYEKMMAPAGARVATVTANSSEFGDGQMNLTQNITIDGAMDPKATAEAVWAYTTQAVEKLRYNNFG